MKSTLSGQGKKVKFVYVKISYAFNKLKIMLVLMGVHSTLVKEPAIVKKSIETDALEIIYFSY
jgi:hypothetical protein